MNIDQARGTKSRRDVRVVTRADIEGDLRTELMLLVHRYIKSANDNTVTPEDAWKTIVDGVMNGSVDMLLVVHAPENEAKGFMYAQLPIGTETAMIHAAYLTPERGNKRVINEALAIFETWARYNKAKKAVFYTHRTPGAHKFMIHKGWSHAITSYSKEI